MNPFDTNVMKKFFTPYFYDSRDSCRSLALYAHSLRSPHELPHECQKIGAHNTIGREEHDEDQDAAEYSVIKGPEISAQRKKVQDHAHDERAPQAPHAADSNDRHIPHGLHDRRFGRANAAIKVREEHTGDSS